MSNDRWIPLESNPEVLNAWSSKAGLDLSQFEFNDIYGLDPGLLDMVIKPVKAVILLFPITDDSEVTQKAEDEALRETTVNPNVFWIKQTISNACGTIGLLHALANSDLTFPPGSPLAQFIQESKGKTPVERATLLETTPLFANIHAEAASGGQTDVPTDLDTNLHFTCFVRAASATGNGYRVIELDGRRAGPIDRGACSDDLLQKVAVIVRDNYLADTTSVQFSMMSLGPAAPADSVA